MSPFPIDQTDVGPLITTALARHHAHSATTTPAVMNNLLRQLIATPNIASKEWVYRQYDHLVRTNTVVLPGSDAAVIRVKETRHSLAMSVDANGRYCRLNPRKGASLAVVEAARNVVCSGARPLAVTNCLNFGNPERPAVMWAFSETIDGMADACRRLGTPVTGGNVSLGNETGERGIDPTPVIGMLGLIEEARHITTQWFKQPGDVILLLGLTRADLGASELLHLLTGEVRGAVPRLDLNLEMAVQQACLESIRKGLVRSAHDCSEGGLAVALAECCFSSHQHQASGAEIDLAAHVALSEPGGESLDPATLLFAESASRIIISVREEHVESVLAIAREAQAPCSVIGRVTEDRLRIANNGVLLDDSVSELERAWRGALAASLDHAEPA